MSETEFSAAARDFDLIRRASSSAVLTVKDDQFEFPWLIDAVRASRHHGGRFRLVDSGRNDVVSLSWLGEAGAEIYSSDEARPDRDQVLAIALAGRKSGAPTYYYIYGPLSEGGEPSGVAADILELGRSGVDLHLSNRDRARSAGELLESAEACRHGRGRFVYYHFGELDPVLENLASAGAWIHWPVRGLDREANSFLVSDILRAGRKSGAGLVLHLEQVWPASQLRRFFEAGAFLQFHTALGEGSPDLRRLEAESERRRPDSRAYYLHLDFLP